MAVRAEGHPFPGQVRVERIETTSRGFTIEFEERWGNEGQRWYCREMIRADVSATASSSCRSTAPVTGTRPSSGNTRIRSACCGPDRCSGDPRKPMMRCGERGRRRRSPRPCRRCARGRSGRGRGRALRPSGERSAAQPAIWTAGQGPYSARPRCNSSAPSRESCRPSSTTYWPAPPMTRRERVWQRRSPAAGHMPGRSRAPCSSRMRRSSGRNASGCARPARRLPGRRSRGALGTRRTRGPRTVGDAAGRHRSPRSRPGCPPAGASLGPAGGLRNPRHPRDAPADARPRVAR